MRKAFFASSLVLLSLVLILLDFLSKAYVGDLFPFAQEAMSSLHKETPLFTGFLGGIDFSISLVHNSGIAWGLFGRFSPLILILRIVVVAYLLWMLFARKNPRADFALVLIVSGALGNILDCLLYGYVIDFLRFDFWGYTFPVFNFADAFITSGVALFLLTSITKAKPTPSFKEHV